MTAAMTAATVVAAISRLASRRESLTRAPSVALFSRRVPRVAIVCAVLLTQCISASAGAEEQCLDPAAELGAAGARKGVQRRDFVKRLRAEISVMGGFWASDLLSTSYDYGGAVAFYPFEDVGVEASLLVTPFSLAVERPLSQFFTGQVFNRSLAFVFVVNALWSPIHFKVRATERAIVHGDLFATVGAGNTWSDTVQGVTFDAGIGLKLYPNKWVAVRFDLRDCILVQEAVAVQRVTNNVIGTAGVSVFVPGPRVKK
jgi:outer membrane beta-barrel protein